MHNILENSISASLVTATEYMGNVVGPKLYQ